jgi:hypothetical protein
MRGGASFAQPHLPYIERQNLNAILSFPFESKGTEKHIRNQIEQIPVSIVCLPGQGAMRR